MGQSLSRYVTPKGASHHFSRSAEDRKYLCSDTYRDIASAILRTGRLPAVHAVEEQNINSNLENAVTTNDHPGPADNCKERSAQPSATSSSRRRLKWPRRWYRSGEPDSVSSLRSERSVSEIIDSIGPAEERMHNLC